MDQTQIDEIVACLPRGRTLFPYFKDRYALMLLTYFVGVGKPMRVVKQSRFGRLLDKPMLRALVRSLPEGRLTRQALGSVWADLETHCFYRLTLGSWGPAAQWNQSWYQTSRPGKNLVLQLNFSGKHNQPYYRLIQPKDGHPFEFGCHPTSRKERTLAWARLDIDLDGGEALIEEIQNDWIREAFSWKNWVDAQNSRKPGARHPDTGPLHRYINTVLKPHVGLWDEAMLSATLWFLREELGIRRIFYHTFDGGNRLKALNDGQPPRSIYTRLPRRFCFRKTSDLPSFLMAHRRVRKEVRKGSIRFFLLDL